VMNVVTAQIGGPGSLARRVEEQSAHAALNVPPRGEGIAEHPVVKRERRTAADVDFAVNGAVAANRATAAGRARIDDPTRQFGLGLDRGWRQLRAGTGPR